MADRSALIAESCPPHYGNAISLIRLPSQLLDPFRSLRAAAAAHRSTEQLLPVIGSEDCSKGTDAILAYLQQRFERSTTDEHCGLQDWIRLRPPSLQTVSVDPDTVIVDLGTQALVGLHVDSWYRREFALTRREHAPNRVCVNLGSTDRFFLFVNVSVGQMYNVVKDKDRNSACGEDTTTVGPSSVARDFMRSFPSYPVVRVRVRPGEAYVAPTENIAHDGSSIDMNAMDVTLSIRGRFKLCQN